MSIDFPRKRFALISYQGKFGFTMLFIFLIYLLIEKNIIK